MNINTNFICVTSPFAETSTHKVKIEAKISQKRATILSIGPLFISFPGQAILCYWIIYWEGESALFIRGALESNRTVNTYLKCLLVVLEDIHLKPLETRLFITTSNDVCPNCFLTFQMLVLAFCFALSVWLFVLCWRYQKQDVICDMKLPYADMVCGILGLIVSMLDDGRWGNSFEFHWGGRKFQFSFCLRLQCHGCRGFGI